MNSILALGMGSRNHYKSMAVLLRRCLSSTALLEFKETWNRFSSQVSHRRKKGVALVEAIYLIEANLKPEISSLPSLSSPSLSKIEYCKTPLPSAQ